jgi:hypothetical protein
MWTQEINFVHATTILLWYGYFIIIIVIIIILVADIEGGKQVEGVSE